MEETKASKGRAIGVGGIFFKSADKERLNSWYRDNLGMGISQWGFAFEWRAHDRPETEHQTAWSVFAQDSKKFDPSPAPFMVNYIVDDMDAILAKLAANGATIDPKREEGEYGRFAWVFDADGNKIELWEPPAVTS